MFSLHCLVRIRINLYFEKVKKKNQGDRGKITSFYKEKKTKKKKKKKKKKKTTYGMGENSCKQCNRQGRA